MTVDDKVPAFFRPFASVRGFTFFTCIYGFFSGFFSLYTVSQLTSIAKQFNMSADRAGFLVSSSEFGFILATVLTGHFLSRSHRPRILFVMGCMNGLACVVAAIPYFVDLKYDPNALNFHSNDTGVCDATRVLEQCQYFEDKERLRLEETVFGIFMVATILAGFATSGVWTIGVTYVDDNCDPKKSPFYLGIIFFVRFLSPVGALLAGAGFSALPLHLEDNGLTPADVSWISAWWLGYISIGLVNILVGIPLIFFPKRLRDDVKNDGGDVTNGGGDVSGVRSTDRLDEGEESPGCWELCKDFPRTVARLLCNPILLFICLGLSIEFSVAVAYPTFVPLYLEVYFKVTATTANIIAGVSGALAVALGVLLSGWLVSKVRASLNKIAAVAAVGDFAVTLLFLSMLAISCDNPPMAGVNTPNQLNVSEPCNVGCNCDVTMFNPVCGSDGITYKNPCLAGCLDMDGNGIYPNCTCIGLAGTATPGPCGSTCEQSVALYGTVLAVISAVLSGAAMPIYLIALRCTKVEDKSMAIAIMNVMTSSAIIPLPVIFGIFMNMACLVNPESCYGGGGYCLFYDNEKLRFILHIITFGARLLPPIFYALALFFARNTKFAGDAQLKDEEEREKEGDRGFDNFGGSFVNTEKLETHL